MVAILSKKQLYSLNKKKTYLNFKIKNEVSNPRFRFSFPIIDVYSRFIVGWKLSNIFQHQIVIILFKIV